MAQHLPEQLISEIISANDLGELAGRYTTLKRSGNSLVGLCPFHKEKTPSFHVASDMQLYYCFGCGAGGNVVSFVQTIENLDFVDAVKLLAERANITIPETGFAQQDRERYEKKQLIYKINTDAAKFFRTQLIDGKSATAMEYVQKRGISSKMINVYGLGYAPEGWSSATDHLLSLGYKKEDLLIAGISGKAESGKFYDRFRNRLMFPIIDVRGNIIGFGGRIFSGDGAKYLNSPETLVFNKRQNLFSLNLARKTSPEMLILVEGYMDVLSLYQSGVQNAVASLGTAFTEEQARLISRYVKEAVLCYDTDDAGIKATNRAIEVFRGTDVNIKILNLPEGKDPDEFVKKNGGEAFRQLVSNAKSVIGYKLAVLEKKYNLSDVAQKVEFAAEASKIISTSHSAVERDLYSKIIAEKTGTSSKAVETQVNKNNRRNDKREQRSVIRESITNVVRKRNVPKLLDAQRKLLSLFAFDSKTMSVTDDVESIFTNDVHLKILEKIKSGSTSDAALLINSFSGDDAAEAAASLSMPLGYEDKLAAARELVASIKKEQYNARMEKAMKDGDVSELNRLILEKNKR